ncbi:sugar ABC transporter permease [Paenibacillus sp. YN15]|nr:sugar ABC transporter permease [Paenibacillus sp. YN15]
MALPCLLYFLVFKYLPMYGVIIAFKDYEPTGGFWGILKSEWVGLQNFKMFFTSIYFGRLMKNTLLISFYRLLFGFPAPILLAILINEIKNVFFKKTVQTITYMPHFLSWVVVSGFLTILLSTTGGPVNALLERAGIEPIVFIADKSFFRSLLVLSDIWKGIGWGTIIYLAALTNVNPELYEASMMDGASKFRQVWHISLPGIKEIIAIMLILAVGRILDENFEQIFNLYSPAVYEVADVFETYVYRQGLVEAKFSYSAAVGLFKSVVSLIMVILSNAAAKKLGSDGIW